MAGAMKAGNFSFTTVKNLAKYSDLERYFEIQRVEHEAAKTIQKCWRRTRLLLPWRRAVVCQKMAQRIQKRIRGVLTRKWVAEWYCTRNNIVITWQAHSRRYVSNNHLRPVLAMEKQMATRIQRIIRGRLARTRCFKLQRDIAATRIQVLWRGVVGRKFTDRLWLQSTVIPVQSMYRRRLAQKRFGAIKAEFNNAALRIQKKFRNWYSCRKMGDKLFDREMDYRMSNIKMLTSEEELCQEYLTKSMERLVKNQFKEKAEKATKALIDCEGEIYLKENDLTEFHRQVEILSSRARQQGFDVELAKNIKDTREAVTALKLKYIFELSAEVHKADEVLEDQVYEVEAWAAHRNRVSAWRSDQYDERRHLNYKRELLARRRAKRIAVAEEKRRWAVYYFTSDGKPDKKRRPGRPWDASIYAGPDKAVYCAGGVNLMAHIQREKIKRAGGTEFKMGSIKSVEQTLHEVSLQTYLEEVNLYEQLLNPIAQIMEKNMGVNPMGLSALAQGGWGQEGEKMVPALRDIGVITSPSSAPKRSLAALNFSEKAQSAASSRRSSVKLSARSDTSKKGSGSPRKSGTAQSSRQSSYNNTHTGTPASALSRQSSYNDSYSPTGVLSKQVSWNDRIPAPPLSKQVSWNENSFSSRASEVSETPVMTPQEVLAAVKARKKKARKSYLPALDAHSIIYEHQRNNQADQPFVGDLKTMNRLFEKQAALEAANNRKDDGADNKSVIPSGASVMMASQSQKSVVSRMTQQLSPLVRAGAPQRALVATDRGLQQSLQTGQTSAQPSGSQLSEQEVFWNDINKAAREEAEAQRREVVEKRRARKRAMVRSSTIPWELLDQVDGAKVRFEHEKLYHDFNHKY